MLWPDILQVPAQGLVPSTRFIVPSSVLEESLMVVSPLPSTTPSSLLGPPLTPWDHLSSWRPAITPEQPQSTM
jgi:hypothetical protein